MAEKPPPFLSVITAMDAFLSLNMVHYKFFSGTMEVFLQPKKFDNIYLNRL